MCVPKSLFSQLCGLREHREGKQISPGVTQRRIALGYVADEKGLGRK